MRNFIVFVVLLFLITSSCIAQRTDWLRTDKKEFEKIFPYFDTIIRNSLYYNKISKLQEDAIPDTLSVGTWKGTMSDVSRGLPEEITLNIVQVYPFIKGYLSYPTPSITDLGGPFDTVTYRLPDSVREQIRGIRKGTHYILLWQLNDYAKEILIFLEGSCFKDKKYDKMHYFMGNFAAEFESDHWLTKGNFSLKKELKP